MTVSWLVNGGDPMHLATEMIIQVDPGQITSDFCGYTPEN